MNTTAVLVTLVVYKVGLVAIGIWASRRVKSQTDFFIGGRGLGAWAAGLSYAASTSSAWVLLGFSGFVFATGLSALWMIPGIWAGYAVVWLWFGPRLREEARRENHVTLTDFLTARAGGFKTAIALTAAAMIVFCFLFYTAAQFQAAGSAFSETFNMATTHAVLLGAGVVLVYAFLGGFWAISLTDTVQGVMMAVVAVVLPATALVAAGGPAGVLESLSAAAPAGYLSWTAESGGGSAPGLMFAGFLIGVWGVGLGALGQPHLLNRLMAVKDEASRRRGFAIAITWAVVLYIGMATLALSGRALLGEAPDQEAVFYRLAADLLPSVLAGVVIAAVLSAVMSTADSILLVAASAIAHDAGLARRVKSRELLASRLVMAAIGAGAVVLTLYAPASIFSRVLFAWSALGAAFGPIVVARVAGVEPRPWAIWLAMVTGFTLTVVFNQLPNAPGDIAERVLPWVPALVILFAFRVRERRAQV